MAIPMVVNGDGGGISYGILECQIVAPPPPAWSAESGQLNARSSQVELPNVCALYFSLSITPTRALGVKFCLGRDRDRTDLTNVNGRWPRIRKRSLAVAMYPPSLSAG